MEKEKEKIMEEEKSYQTSEENANENAYSEQVAQESKKEDVQENKKEEKDTTNKEEVKEVKEEKNTTEQEKTSTTIPKNKKSKKKIIILAIILIIVLLFLSTIFAIINMNNTNILKGVYIEGLEVSNLNKDEINSFVNEKISTIEEIELSYNNYEEVIKLQDMGVTVNGKEAIKEAIELGKTTNIVIDNYSILKTMLFKTNLKLNIEINEEQFKEMIKNTQAEMPEAVKEYSYEIKDNKLIITNGKSGKTIDVEKLKEQIIENIKLQFNGESKVIEIPTTDTEPAPIDVEQIYHSIYKEAKDAYIIEDPFELHKEEDGVDFEISIEEAKAMVQEEKETYEIPLKITKPRVAVKNLGDKLFKQKLSKYTTIYDSSNTNRASNIALAAKTINGTILLPGETFSYNGTLGNTTKEKGYKPGGAYVGGKIVQTYGGGICQVSSTLYNAVLYANLEIVERYNHSYSVTYVPAGRDATVSYGGKDFKFKNTRNYPIRISANAKNGVVSISIEGIKEEKEYEIELTSTVLSTTPYETVFEKNSNLEEGKQKVIQVGHTGQKSIAYKIVKYNGKTISKTVLSKDTYKPMNRIVQVGTKKTVTSTPPETTTPTNTNPTGTTTQTTPAESTSTN